MQKVRWVISLWSMKKIFFFFFFCPVVNVLFPGRIRPVLRNVRLVLPGKIFTTLLPMLHVMVCWRPVFLLVKSLKLWPIMLLPPFSLTEVSNNKDIIVMYGLFTLQ
jgi:hypothetical protein